MSSVLQRAAEATACRMLLDIGSAGTQMAVWTMWTKQFALIPLTVGGLAYMAHELGCVEMDGPPTNQTDPLLNGCIKGAPGKGYQIQHRIWTGDIGSCMQPFANEIVSVGPVSKFNGYWGHQIEFKTADGGPGLYKACVSETEQGVAGVTYWLNVPEGECADSNNPDDPGDPIPPTPEYEYTDPETNCNYALKLEGFVQQYENGPAEPVWNIRSADSARSDGGRMGGCSLSPTIYVGGDGSGGGGGGPNPIPVPPNPPGPDGDGVPWWLKALLGATTGALLNQIGRIMNDTFNYPMEPGAFELIAPCDFDAEGGNESRQWAFQKTPLILRLHDHQVAMMEIMQQHLDWKTPTCDDNEKPPLEGQWVTTRWESIEKMAHSGRRLRKLFRYRTKSSRDLGQLSAYWADFSWRAGDVCVIHKGAWWGTPQVWAESEDEGKRVIRHAATEAGIDPDQIGGWSISSSRSPRYGMSGTMKAAIFEGFPWIASRDGAAWPNILAKQPDP